MRRIYLALLTGALTALTVAAIGCNAGGTNVSTGGNTRLNGAGATFIYPMMSTWADEYRKAKGAEVNYQSIGSGAGIQQMTPKTVNFGCSDAPMNEEQLAKCKANGAEAVHIPLAMGSVGLAYHLNGA